MPKFWDYIHDDSGGRVLRLEGPIDSDSFWGEEITPQDFRDELYAEDGDLTLWINSPGGNVFAAAEIYTMIRDYPHKVTVRIASIAASAASVIAIARGERVLLFGDMKNYWVADRQNRTFRRLNELYARTDQVGFLTTQRVDGRLILPESVKVLKMAGTKAATGGTTGGNTGGNG
jgi:hypothetical protein